MLKVSGGAAPKIYAVRSVGSDDARYYGPFGSPFRLTSAVRTLNDLLGLRDCALTTPIVYAEQCDLFTGGRRAACMRHELGTCTGPFAGFVTKREYLDRVGTAVAFLEGRGVSPVDRVVAGMTEASDANEFELAARWRERFDDLEWLLGAVSRTRAFIEALTFIYLDPGAYGDDRAYIIRRATVRASAGAPHTLIEREAFKSLIAEHIDPEPAPGPLPVESMDEMLLLMSWFRQHPGAMLRTIPLGEWR